MFAELSWVVTAVYLALPIIGIGWLARVGCWRQRVSLAVAFVLGSVVGAGLVGAASSAMGQPYPFAQYLLGAYLGVATVLMLKVFDLLVTRMARWFFGASPRDRLSSPSHTSSDDTSSGVVIASTPLRRSSLGFLARASAVQVARIVALAGVAMPWLLAGMMTFRPRAGAGDDPMKMLGYPFERIEFSSADGKRLVGWFMPAHGKPSDQTVLICHGLGASKSNFLPLAGGFVPDGFNVFLFDFRAHGESAGQITSFGDAERQDVLGAVAWLKRDRSRQSLRIHGLGISMGGAALVSAAAGRETEGAQIDSVCVISTYDSFVNQAQDMLSTHMGKTPARILVHGGAFFASLHAGRDLGAFSPAEQIDRIWPRPVFVIHGNQDPLIPVERGRALFERAAYPRQSLFVHDGDHMNLLGRQDIFRSIRAFFENARPVPVI